MLLYIFLQKRLYLKEKSFNYDRYLTNLYHDYMQLPPEEKRERHFIVKFQLPND